MNDEWQPIETAPDDFDRPGGQRPLELMDARTGRECIGQRALFNNSGWLEIGSNREIAPTHWRFPASPSSKGQVE